MFFENCCFIIIMKCFHPDPASAFLVIIPLLSLSFRHLFVCKVFLIAHVAEASQSSHEGLFMKYSVNRNAATTIYVVSMRFKNGQ